MYDDLKEKIAHELQKYTYWGKRKDILCKMDQVTNSFDAVKYSVALEEDFDQALLFLPSALEYVFNLQENHENTQNQIVHYMGTWQKQLVKADLWLPLIENIARTLDIWNTIYHKQLHEPVSVLPDVLLEIGITPSVNYLNEFFENYKLFTGASIYATLFEQWCYANSNTVSSLNLLNFLLRVRICPEDMKIYTAKEVLCKAFDCEFCQKHFDTIKFVSLPTISPEYLCELQSVLLK